MKKAGIYKITNRGNNKVYIGSSVNLDNRKRQHFYLLSKNNHTNRYLQYAYNLHGGENFKWEIIEYVEKLESLEEVKKKLLEREQHWLDLFFGEDCYNFNPTAGSNLGIKLSKETRIRIGRANSIALRGRKLPQDVIEKIRLGNLGKKMSPESIEKTRQANIGKKLSEEHKRKIGEKSKGRTSKKVINLDTNVVFNNITEASLFYNLDITSIVKVCKGKRKTCGGFRWSYLD